MLFRSAMQRLEVFGTLTDKCMTVIINRHQVHCHGDAVARDYTTNLPEPNKQSRPTRNLPKFQRIFQNPYAVFTPKGEIKCEQREGETERGRGRERGVKLLVTSLMVWWFQIKAAPVHTLRGCWVRLPGRTQGQENAPCAQQPAPLGSASTIACQRNAG